VNVVRTAIVGMGIGKLNGLAIARHPRGRVVALCDLLEDRMAEFAKELPEPVRCYTDYKELCKDKEVDAIFVGSPNQWHVPIALEAIRCDKHVLVTKPLADQLAPARRLIGIAEAAGVVNMMSLSTRYSRETQYLGRLVRSGELGEVYYGRARSIRRSGIPDWSLGFIEAGGGAFRDMGVHVLDSAWWMMGMPQPVSVSGVGGAKFGPLGRGFWEYRTPSRDFFSKYASDDYAGGIIRFENGAGLQVESFWASHQPDNLQIELFGTEAGAQLHPLTIYRTVEGAPSDAVVKLPKGPDPWEMIADHFINCILDGAPCGASLRHGLIVQEMLEAMLQSAQTGREVRIRTRAEK